MGKMYVPDEVNMESGSPQRDIGKSTFSPVSLQAFLQEENIRLRARVAELRQDTAALREALRDG